MEDVSVFKYKKVSPFFACILCDRTLRNAATISECLDTCKFFFTLFLCLKLGFDLCFFFFHFLLLYFVAKSLSLITVCRECIERKIVDENLNHCPICNVDLGCSPLDKLRYVSAVQYIYQSVLDTTTTYVIKFNLFYFLVLYYFCDASVS